MLPSDPVQITSESDQYNSSGPSDNASPDDEEDFDFSCYPDLDTPLYLVPQADQNHISVFSPETLRETPLSNFQPDQLQFQNLMDLHKFCYSFPMDLSQYWIVLPATHVRYLRRHYYKKDPPGSFPLYISKLPQ